MVGDDANIVFIELLKQLLEIIRNMSNGRYAAPKIKTKQPKQPKQPKIKIGSISKKDFEKLKKAGLDFKYLTIPQDKLAELEKTARDLGGSFFAMQLTEGNNAVIAVPTQFLNEIDVAVKHIAAEQLKNSPLSLIIKDGNEKIAEEDIELTTDVLRQYDIPAYSFKSADGTYMNVVPKEFDGQYQKAMEDVKLIKEQIKNFDVTRYEQTAPLDSLDYAAEEISPEEAQELNKLAAQDSLDIKIVKNDDKTVALYPLELADTVKELRDEYSNSLAESEKFLIDVSDDTITMNKDALVVGEDNKSYFVRVPNTAGLDHIFIDKNDVQISDDGKTLSMKLDMDNDYMIFDKDKELQSSRKGSELSQCYNTKHKHIDKDTEVYQAGNNFRRIDLYCKEQNKLISLGINSAAEIRTELLKQGISAKATEKLLEDINKKLPDNYKEIFNYTAEKAEIVYADVPNIGELLAQSQLSQTVIGKAECVDEIPKDNGSKCCIFDKTANQFAVLPILPRLEIMSRLTEMGYNQLLANELSNKIIGSYNGSDLEKTKEVKRESPEVNAKTFESNNPELKDFMYYNTDNSIIIVQDNADNYKYMEIDKGLNLSDVESAVLRNFDIKDELSSAEIMRQLAKENIIDVPAPIKVGDVSISQISANYIEISNESNSAIMSKDKIDSNKLSSMGISDKDKEVIIKSFSKAEETVKSPKKQSLQGLKKHAKENKEKVNISKETAKSTPTRNQER